MARNFVLLGFFALVSVQVCLAGPTTTPAPLAIPSFNDIVANAQKSITDASAHIQHMFGLPEYKPEEFVASVKTAATDFTKKLNETLSTVKAEVDPNAKAAADAFQKFFTEINKTTEDLRKKIPELQAADAEKIWSKSLQTITDAGNKLKTALEKEAPHAQESLTKAASSILENTVKAANSFADHVHEAVGHDKHAGHAAHHKA